jgi:hypothetical protein
VLGGIAKRLLPRAAGAVGKAVGRVFGSRAGRTAVTIAGTIGAERIMRPAGVPALPPGFPPGFAPGGGAPRPQPREGKVGRTVSRVLPGGMTGREFMPATDMTDRVGRPLAVYPEEVSVTRGPSGYVMVNMNGNRIAMLRPYAIKAGLYSAPPKPPVSGWDMRAITRAKSAKNRVKKLAGKVGLSTKSRGR